MIKYKGKQVMQTTKLNLVLAEPEVPVPDTAYTGGFMGSASASGNIIAMIITVTILSIITGVIIYKLYKAKKLNLLIPVFLILGLTTATFSPLFINANKHAFAVDSYATIETPEQVDMNGEIKESTFTSSKVTITKPDATNYGYELYILANEANDDLNFVPKTETNETVITSIEQEGALTANTYGFTLEQDAKAEDEVWYPLSYVADLLASYDTATTTNNTTDVYFGVLTDNTVTPDTYELDIDFYATASQARTFAVAFNVAGKTTYNNTEYYAMQDMNSNICGDIITPTATQIAPEARLIDVRDNKVYWVAKLADGNCWMTQNLDHDIVTTENFYTSKNTDLNVANEDPVDDGYFDGYSVGDDVIYWTFSDNFSTASTNVYRWRPKFWDGGDYYYYNSGTTMTEYDSLNGCASEHTEEECLHYSTGNRYNWTAAIASNNSTDYIVDTDYHFIVASNSICPAGWRLPIGKNSSSYSEFSKLFYEYGIIPALTYGGAPSDPSYASTGYARLRTSPLYFVNGGYATPSNGIINIGKGGYWSSTLHTDAQASRLDFDGSRVNPWFDSNRGYGFAVRCIAK